MAESGVSMDWSPIIGTAHLRFEASNELDERLLEFYRPDVRRRLGSQALYVASDATAPIIDGYSDYSLPRELEQSGLTLSELSRIDATLRQRARHARRLHPQASFKRFGEKDAPGLRIELRVELEHLAINALRYTAFLDSSGMVPVHHDILMRDRAEPAQLLAAKEALETSLAGDRPLNVASLEIAANMTPRPKGFV